jgi:hypothetical protein
VFFLKEKEVPDMAATWDPSLPVENIGRIKAIFFKTLSKTPVPALWIGG